MSKSSFSPDIRIDDDLRKCLLHGGENLIGDVEAFALDEKGFILHDMPKLRESIDRLSDLIEKYMSKEEGNESL